MPKFRVTTDNGDGPNFGDEPFDFKDEKAATDDAQLSLFAMAFDMRPHGKVACWRVCVEDDTGRQVYQADLRFSSKDGADMDREDLESDAAAIEIAEYLSGRSRE
ncbi:hypothetical protein ABIE41_001396 [Bosea sp. OAE506]